MSVDEENRWLAYVHSRDGVWWKCDGESMEQRKYACDKTIGRMRVVPYFFKQEDKPTSEAEKTENEEWETETDEEEVENNDDESEA